MPEMFSVGHRSQTGQVYPQASPWNGVLSLKVLCCEHLSRNTARHYILIHSFIHCQLLHHLLLADSISEDGFLAIMSANIPLYIAVFFCILHHCLNSFLESF